MDDLYELFLVRDPKLDLYQGIFSTFPDLQEYSMNDLYSKHPDPAKEFLYKWAGRADDVIVLSNGENLAPAQMEASLLSSEKVKGAMVVGRGRFQPAALLDLGDTPPETANEEHAILEELESGINEANENAPAHGQLDTDHILFVDQSRPINYLGQGKIQRHKTNRLYEKDIEDVYAAEDFDGQLDPAQSGIGDLPKIDFSHQSSIKKWLQELIAEIADIDNLKEDDTFFEAGLDSLRVLRIVRELKVQIKLAGSKHLTPESLSPGVVYSHPSLNELSAFLFKQTKLASQDVDSGYQSAESDRIDGNSKLKDMESFLDKFVQSLPVETKRQHLPVTQSTTVLLTGSTGSLGSYLLNELSSDPNVQHIICLDRTSSAAEKHRETGPERGLSPLDPGRVEFLKASLADPQLGVGSEVYRGLLNTVTHIIRKATSPSIVWGPAESDTNSCYCRLPMASQLQLDSHLVRAVHRGCAESRPPGSYFGSQCIRIIRLKRRLCRWMERPRPSSRGPNS